MKENKIVSITIICGENQIKVNIPEENAHKIAMKDSNCGSIDAVRLLLDLASDSQKHRVLAAFPGLDEWAKNPEINDTYDEITLEGFNFFNV